MQELLLRLALGCLRTKILYEIQLRRQELAPVVAAEIVHLARELQRNFESHENVVREMRSPDLSDHEDLTGQHDRSGFLRAPTLGAMFLSLPLQPLADNTFAMRARLAINVAPRELLQVPPRYPAFVVVYV